MFRVGVHVSIAGSIDLAVDRAVDNGCTTFQIFTRNPRRWKYIPLSQEQIQLFKEKLSKVDIKPIVAHMPYLSNLASPNNDIYVKSKKSLKIEIDRCSTLNIPFLVTHLGSHLGKGKEEGIKRVTAAINESLEEIEGKEILLLENTSGTQNSIGGTFQDIQRILEQVTVPDRTAICFDICHAFAAGYDLRSEETVESTMNEFDRLIGLKRLKVIHANDSKGDLGSHIDRHEHIGLGKIGRRGFKAIISYNNFKYLPYVLETPVNSKRSDKDNLEEMKRIIT
jgi:deoxyribonuclease-4